MDKILGTIFGIISIIILGAFAIVTCILTSNMNKYEGYHRKREEDEQRRNRSIRRKS